MGQGLGTSHSTLAGPARSILAAGRSATSTTEAIPMAKAGDFTDILIKRGILGADQLGEAKTLQQQTGAKLQDALVKLGYATIDDIMSAVAEHSGMQSVNLTDLTIPQSIIEMVPESVARENIIVPLSHENNVLKIV